jgi:hypothetical protein
MNKVIINCKSTTFILEKKVDYIEIGKSLKHQISRSLNVNVLNQIKQMNKTNKENGREIKVNLTK